MKVETKIQMEQRLKNEARQRIKDRINEKMEIQIKQFKNKKKQEMTKPLIITIHFINKNMITFNTMYFIKITPTLIQNTSRILK